MSLENEDYESTPASYTRKGGAYAGREGITVAVDESGLGIRVTAWYDGGVPLLSHWPKDGGGHFVSWERLDKWRARG